MRAFFAGLALLLSITGGAFAGAADGCRQAEDTDLKIRACTLVIEGKALGLGKLAAYNNRAHAYLAKRDYDRAMADSGQALRLDPRNVTAYNYRCWALNGKGDHDRAIADCGEAIRIAPEYAPPYTNRGNAYLRKGDYELAGADYGEAIRLDPTLANPHTGRCGVLYHQGDYERALADCNRAMELDPKAAAAYSNRGLVYGGKGDNDRAMADFDRAIGLDPALPDTRAAKGWLFIGRGDYRAAKTEIEEALRLSPAHPAARAGHGHILLALGNAQGALAEFNEALRLKANVANSYWGRGQAYERVGHRSLALADYKKAIELKPTGPDDIFAQKNALARIAALEAPVPAAGGAAAASAKPHTPMGRRVALVIGNSAYKAVGELANPRNDAAAVAGGLGRLGFEVIEKHDLGIAAMRKALGEFEDKTAGAEWGFVYYAGHGMELDGHNWLIPVDAELARATDMADEAIALDRVLARLNAASKLRVVILDACRNNPFMTRMVMNRVSTRAVTRGLAAVEPSHGEVVFYAARDGSVALDGKGANSPFAAALVKHMGEDGVELGWFFREVTSTVLAATGNQQEPFVYGRLPAEQFYFKPPR
jgi:tetratricopeptide (TPR) repeat protein